ncbi:hypothetical protein [Dyadobacter psychrotolerans]|nr:hypothetical protein [Dyadobacter psychrotolerans]
MKRHYPDTDNVNVWEKMALSDEQQQQRTLVLLLLKEDGYIY